MADTSDIALAEILITLGGLFLIGLAADVVSRHSPLPRVTLLLLAGFLVGPSMLNWLPEFAGQWFPILTTVALAMIGFLLGGRLTRSRLRGLGPSVLGISLGIVVTTATLIIVALTTIGVRLEIALLLGAIATSTDPMAVADVVSQLRARGRFTDTLLNIVAIDDAWGVLAFSVLLAVAQMTSGHGGALDSLEMGVRSIGGAVLLGVALGVPAAYLTGRIRPGDPTQAEALGLVLLAAGLAEWLGASSILTALILGACVANLAKHHEHPFHAIEGIEWPFLILFFLLAGASLRISALADVWLIAAAFIMFRVIGRQLGVELGGRLVKVSSTTRRWMGIALLPQAGVALGMALLAAQQFPELGDVIIPVVLAATVIFELLGPVATRSALIRVGDVPTDNH